MQKTLEKTGRTEDLAIAAALEELKLDRSDVSVMILERARSGFLGIGACPAKVLVTYEVPDEKPVPAKKPQQTPPVKQEQQKKKPAEQKKPQQVQSEASAAVETPKSVPAKEAPKAAPAKEAAKPAPVKEAVTDENPEYAAIREFLTGLLDRMNVKADIEIGPRENGGISVNLSGNGMGAIIGRRGETLDAIQHLTNYVINRGNDKRMHISIDAEAYRSKREESLTHLAEKMAEKAIKYKRSMALEPMNSYERHVIHTALQNYEGVTTASTGEEPNRRVVVNYIRQDGDKAAQSSRPKTREWA